MSKVATCFVLAFLMLTAGAFGQAQFLDEGQDGIGFSAGFAGSGGTTDPRSIVLQVGFAPSTRMDFGVGLSKILVSGDDAFVLSPYMDFFLVNENNGDVPFSIALTAQFDAAMSSQF